MYKLHILLVILPLLQSPSSVLGQLVKGSFGLATTDPICIQCQDATVQWYGGIPPYVLSVSGYHNSYDLASVGTTQTNQMKWHVNFPTGTRLWFQLLDGNGTDIYTSKCTSYSSTYPAVPDGRTLDIVTVASSVDASCVNVTNPLVTDPSTSTTLGSATSSRSATAESATATSAPNRMTSSHNTVAPIAGGIAGGVIALILLIFCFLWLKRRNKRNMGNPHAQKELDLNEDAYVAEPFTIHASSGASRPEGASKMGSATVFNPTAQHLDYSSSGTSVPITINAGPSSSTQLIQNEPHTMETSQSPIAMRKDGPTRDRTGYDGPVQEQDAGVSLSGYLQPEVSTTLPPAYDNSWRT
ncbi:hypothetical protein OPQ81_009775 [Rhizoctonia solani]|nr:hypothetical protein OPQ81_009775 [Rhizoctonia solani]